MDEDPAAGAAAAVDLVYAWLFPHAVYQNHAVYQSWGPSARGGAAVGLWAGRVRPVAWLQQAMADGVVPTADAGVSP